MLKCSLLGEVRFVIDGQATALFPSQKAQRLFCYLLLHRDRSPSRNILINALWPDRDEHSARRSLSTALWRLRQALKDDEQMSSALIVSGDTIGFNPRYPCWLDVAVFEEACLAVQGVQGRELSAAQASALQSAVALYRGELMEGCYDDWCLVKREQLASLHLQALAKLMNFHNHHGRVTEAITYGQRILAIDPLQERIHRALMRLYHQIGDRVAAIRQFERCKELLARELDIEPMPETIHLYREIRGEAHPQTNGAIASSNLQPARVETTLEIQYVLAHLIESRAQLADAMSQMERAMNLVELLLTP